MSTLTPAFNVREQSLSVASLEPVPLTMQRGFRKGRETVNQARFITGIFAVALLAACSAATSSPTVTPRPTGADTSGIGNSVQSRDFVPPVKGLYQGEELFFIHTETSDPEVATLLTMMMGPQVVLVPSLAEAPESALANVYVFTNGVKGDGPFGFQADVFDSVPGDQGYSPLRSINLVTWKESAIPSELRSMEKVREAETIGEVTIERPGIVVNMPILRWPGGNR